MSACYIAARSEACNNGLLRAIFRSSNWGGARWKVETEWWKQPVVREYWKALLNSNLLCEIYHDLSRDEWFVERVYD